MVMHMGRSTTIIIVSLALAVSLVVSVVYMLRPVKIVEINGWVSIRPTGAKIAIRIYPKQDTELPVNVDRGASYREKSVPWTTYALNHGKPKVTESNPQELGIGVVNLTVRFLLITPANKTIEFEPLELREGGEHNYTLILGPNENITAGKFKLVIEFYLQVRTPAGIVIGPIRLTPVTLEFQVT